MSPAEEANSCEGDKVSICPVAPVVPRGAWQPEELAPRLQGSVLDTARTAIREISQVVSLHTPCVTSGAGKHLALPSARTGWSSWTLSYSRFPHLLLGSTHVYVFLCLLRKHMPGSFLNYKEMCFLKQKY